MSYHTWQVNLAIMTWNRTLLLFLLSLSSSFQVQLDPNDPANVVNLYFQHIMSSQECGLVKAVSPIRERIVGGEDAEPGEMPWIAILGYKTDDYSGKL